jgi:hypothetical protein
MTKNIPLILLILLFSAFHGTEKPVYPIGDFRWPIDHEVLLSGTFGELRFQHFHTGVDIKPSKGREGDPLYSAGDGYISRIQIRGGGYGNALYISHPNGFTSVYAHLLEYNEPLQRYIHQRQHDWETFELDLQLTPQEFPVKRGDYIGKMGNTGASMGAHLHFEIRHTHNDVPVNPLLFGLKAADQKEPRIQGLRLYEFDDLGEVLSERDISLRRRNNDMGVFNDTLVVRSERIGFAVKAFDYHERTHNTNGIFELNMLLNDSLAYHFEMSEIPFEHTRFINAHTDYREHYRRNYWHRCFRLPGNKLNIYRTNAQNGILHIPKSPAPQLIQILVSDYNGNQQALEFWVRSEPVPLPVSPPPFNYYLPFEEASILQLPDLEVFFPAGSFYQDLRMDYATSIDQSSGHFSRVHHLHNPLTPVHDYFEIAILPDRELTEAQRARAFIAHCAPGGTITHCGGQWKPDGKLYAQVRELGDYCILTDERPPSIKPLRFSSDMRRYTFMSFSIGDNFRTARNVSGLHYRATINGEWVLFEYDAKTHQIRHYFSKELKPGQHQFKLELRDASGNISTFERGFRR